MTMISKEMRSRTLIVLGTLTAGALLWMARAVFPPESEAVKERLADIVRSAQTFCMALASIMAGVFAFATTARDSYWMKRFRSSGMWSDFVFCYCLTVFCLLASYLVGLVALARPTALAPSLALLFVGFLHALLVMFNAFVIHSKASSPTID